MIMPDSPTLAVVVSLSTSQPISKIKERKVTLNAEPFSTVNDYVLFRRIHYVSMEVSFFTSCPITGGLSEPLQTLRTSN
jgi:hypothetical protein